MRASSPLRLVALTRVALLVVAVLAAAPAQAQEGGEIAAPTDHVSEAQRREIGAMLDANRLAYGIPSPEQALRKSSGLVRFGWPLTSSGVLGDPSVFAVFNHVDQNAASGATLDYACTARTYDGHRGQDMGAWPFSLLRMDADEVRIVAAAPGVLIGKQDGHFDRQCSMQPGVDWNAAYIQHDDGSVAWYGHMKSGSVTGRAVGTRVAQGEMLGVVGSSGNSTGPHLHFEVRGPDNALVEPYAGSCNRFNGATSWWAAQPPARQSTVMAVRTHSAPPVLNTCPQNEQVNEKRSFYAPGERFFFAVYLRDQLPGQPVVYGIVNPAGAIVASWTQTLQAEYALSYWYYSYTLPANASGGDWQAQILYEGQTHVRRFAVGQALAGEDDRAEIVRVGAVSPNPVATYATLPVEAPPGTRVTVDVYDLTGRQRARLHEGAAGPLTLSFDALPSGPYLLRIQAGSTAVTRLVIHR